MVLIFDLSFIYEVIGKLEPINTMAKLILSLGGILLTKKSKEPVLSNANYDASVFSWKRNNEDERTSYTEHGIGFKIRSRINKRK